MNRFGTKMPRSTPALPRHLYLVAGLALFWAIENCFLQASAFSVPPLTRHPALYQAIRFSFNLLAAFAVLCVFSRFWLATLAVLDCLLSLAIVAYTLYFHKVLAIYYALHSLREGLQVRGFAFRIIPPFVWLLLVSALIIKLFWISRLPRLPAAFRRRGAIISLSLLMVFLSLLQLSSFKFTSIRMTTVARSIYVYGYVTAWIADSILAPDTEKLSEELIQLQKISPDRLESSEPPWPVGDKIALIQAESLDYSVIHYKINGREVTPYLNRLSRDGRFFKLRAYHDVCTADMDFAVLSGGTPSSRLNSYTISGLAYTNSLPRFLEQHGYHTVAWHGNDGTFFHRRSHFEKMGISEIFFKEDLSRSASLASCYWGIRDKELFRLSSDKMRAAVGREFHFIITLDSHGPFDLITDPEKEIFPNSRQWQQNYFNSMRVLDRNIQTYVESLPAGTLVILYGDHTSGVQYEDYQASRNGSAEYVPGIVHVCRPASQGPTRDPLPTPPALIDDLRIHDMVNHMRRQIHPLTSDPLAPRP